MLSKTCTRILRPYGFEDVHTPLPAQYALNRLIRLDRHSGIHTRESRAGPHGGSLELPINPTKGYGFIQPTGGGKDVLVHISAVERAGLVSLNEGQHVEYEIENNHGKESAINLKVK